MKDRSSLDFFLFPFVFFFPWPKPAAGPITIFLLLTLSGKRKTEKESYLVRPPILCESRKESTESKPNRTSSYVELSEGKQCLMANGEFSLLFVWTSVVSGSKGR
jgi:hypothetical protein